MDAIIRAAAVSPLVRHLRRTPERATAMPAPPPPASAVATGIPALPLIDVAPAQPAVQDDAQAKRLAKEMKDEQERAFAAQRAIELEDLRAAAERAGHAAGLITGDAAAHAAIQAHLDRVDKIALELALAKTKVLHDAEDAVVELVFEALCRMLGEGAATRESVLRVVGDCATAAREREQVTIRLHPDDLALLREHAAAGDAGPERVRYCADPEIALGGCIVDSSTGSLDARLETQLGRLRATLSAVRARRHSPGEAA